MSETQKFLEWYRKREAGLTRPRKPRLDYFKRTLSCGCVLIELAPRKIQENQEAREMV
jgi:hypothetical protein